jgi:hypothetical protein
MNVEAYAKELGYVGIRKIGRWNNHDVHEPLMDPADGIPITGIPVFILSRGGEVRTSTVEESFKIMDKFDK